MKNKVWISTAIAALLAISLLAGCASPASSSGTGAQIANPWKDATPAEAAMVLGGKFYNITTLGSGFEQYALMVTTDDSMKKGVLPPTAWVRFHKGDEDVSLQMFKGGKLSDTQKKGKQATVHGAAAYLQHKESGSSEIAWEENGILFLIGTSTDWKDDALTQIAEGVKAQ